MQGNRIRRFGRLPRAAVLAAGVIALSLWASPDTAQAEHRHRRGPVVQHRHHRHGPRVAPRYYGHPGRFVVPPRIHSRQLPYYRPYYHGSVYFAPHRHRHVVYHFPYYGPYGFVELRPYYYCGDDLFVHGGFDYYGPRIGISVGF